MRCQFSHLSERELHSNRDFTAFLRDFLSTCGQLLLTLTVAAMTMRAILTRLPHFPRRYCGCCMLSLRMDFSGSCQPGRKRQKLPEVRVGGCAAAAVNRRESVR